MKLLPVSFFVYLTLYVVGGAAKAAAGAYERVFFYLIYRYEREAYSDANDEHLGEGYIGQECRGVAGGRCNTNEFLNWLNSGNPREDYDFSAGLGTEIDLTPENIDQLAVNILGEPGQTEAFDTKRVAPDITQFSVLFEEADWAIKKANEKKVARSSDYLDRIKQALDSSFTIRRGDYEQNLLDYLTPKFDGPFATTPESFMDVFDWNEIDWKTTKEWYPELQDSTSPDWRELSGMMNWYKNNVPDAQIHFKIKQAQKELRAVLKACGATS